VYVNGFILVNTVYNSDRIRETIEVICIRMTWNTQCLGNGIQVNTW